MFVSSLDGTAHCSVLSAGILEFFAVIVFSVEAQGRSAWRDRSCSSVTWRRHRQRVGTTLWKLTKFKVRT